MTRPVEMTSSTEEFTTNKVKYKQAASHCEPLVLSYWQRIGSSPLTTVSKGYHNRVPISVTEMGFRISKTWNKSIFVQIYMRHFPDLIFISIKCLIITSIVLTRTVTDIKGISITAGSSRLISFQMYQLGVVKKGLVPWWRIFNILNPSCAKISVLFQPIISIHFEVHKYLSLYSNVIYINSQGSNQQWACIGLDRRFFPLNRRWAVVWT